VAERANPNPNPNQVLAVAERGPNGEADPAGDDFPESTLIEALLPQALGLTLNLNFMAKWLTMAILNITRLTMAMLTMAVAVCAHGALTMHVRTYAPCTYLALTMYLLLPQIKAV
jgi:hypothetical protein